MVEIIKCKCREVEPNIEFSKRDEEKIRKTAVEVKHTLSTLEKVIGEVEVEGKVYDFEITCQEFEKHSAELLQATLKMVANLKEKFGGEIDYIVCIGGAYNMPQVQAAFQSEYPDIELKIFNPEKVIAFGAAIYAEHLNEENYLRDICKFSYVAKYVENFEKYHDWNRLRIWNIIYKDEILSASEESTSNKIEDGQKNIRISIYESECTDEVYLPEDGKYIGEIRINDLDDTRKGDETLLTMTIDKSGLTYGC